MYKCEEHDGWTMQVTTVPNTGMFTTIAVIYRGSIEFRFERVGMSATEIDVATRTMLWLREWVRLNRLTVDADAKLNR